MRDDYPAISNKWHEAYGFAQGPASLGYGHQGLIEDIVVNEPEIADPNRLVEGKVAGFKELLLSATEAGRQTASDAIQFRTADVHVNVMNAINHHNWAGWLYWFYWHNVNPAEWQYLWKRH